MKNKRILVTGASSGIGRACAEQFASLGAKLLLCSRRIDVLNQLAQTLRDEYDVEILTVELDIQNAEVVQRVLSDLPIEWHDIDVLVNNAGLALALDPIYKGDIKQWDQMIDTNVKGLLYVTRYVVGKMVARNSGHVINIGSISSHQVYPGGTVYCATKFAEQAITEGTKMDVHGTTIRVTSVDPGMVDTNFSATRFSGDTEKAQSVYKGMTPLQAADVADAVVYAATRPAHVNVREIKIYPTDQTATHLCHRE